MLGAIVEQSLSLRQLSVMTGRSYMTSCHDRAQLYALHSSPYNRHLPQHDRGES
jgi:hypothetical protein